MEPPTRSSSGVLTETTWHKWRKVFLYAIGIVIFLIILVYFSPIVLGLIFRDGPPPNDSDLRLQNISIPDADNAYFDLLRLATPDAPVYENVSLEVSKKEKPWDDKAVVEEVLNNTAAYKVFSVAAHKPKFQDPAFADDEKLDIYSNLPNLSSWRAASRASRFYALHLAKQGKHKEAMEEALNSVRIGQKIQDSQVLLIEYLVALAMKGIGLEIAQKLLTASTLSSNELRQYIREFEQYSENEGGLVSAFKLEYYGKLQSIDDLVLGRNGAEKVRPNYRFQPNNTKTIFANEMRTLIRHANAECKKQDAHMSLPPLSLWEIYTMKNAVGRHTSDVVGVSLEGAITKKCQEDVLVSVTQAMFAIKAFKKDTGDYPSLFDDLVPAYISSVPLDPYGGKSLGYSREKKILYSIGEDMQDNGGSTGEDWRKMADPTFVMNF